MLRRCARGPTVFCRYKSIEYSMKRVLDIPAPQMYHVVGDVLSYPQFVPYCRGSEILSHENPHAVMLRIGWNSIEEQFLSHIKFDQDKVIAHAADNAMFKELHCEWTIREIQQQRCLASLLLRFKFQNNVYNYLFQKVGPIVGKKMVSAFSSRAKELAKANLETAKF